MGSLRKSLPKGKITEADIYELMPFNNKLVVITLSGEKTNKLLEYIASQGGEVVANLKMKIKNKKPQDVFIDGKAFDINKKYRILTYDYLASGGDNMKFFLEPIKMELIDIVGRDAILEFIFEETEKGNKLNAQLDGRIFN
jgi:2',3'-cyclic-nucleotide 2'-phosphodiesterase (5'-nucleotidase family)